MFHQMAAMAGPGGHWLTIADASRLEAQHALDDFDNAAPSPSLASSKQPGELDINALRRQLVTARDEYQQEAAYWCNRL